MKIVLVEPFYGGSHAQWIEGLCRHSHHDITLLTLPGRHWKWRMQGGAIALAEEYRKLDFRPDLIIGTSMLDLSSFKALLGNLIQNIPIMLYMHENQLTYPWSEKDPDPGLGRDISYGMIQYRSALVADKIVFNSEFHLKEFYTGLTNFLKQLPDQKGLHRIKGLKVKSEVLYPGIESDCKSNPNVKENEVPVILWNHRWEYDKNPEGFFFALSGIKRKGLPFKLIVLGEHYQKTPEVFEKARIEFKDELLHFGYVEDRKTYIKWLQMADVLPVTTRQEFFGISVAEAVACGCYPILPNRLTFPEQVPVSYHPHLLYQDDLDLLLKLENYLKGNYPQFDHLENSWNRFKWDQLIVDYHKSFFQLVHKGQTQLS